MSPPPQRRFRLRLGELFRIQAGVAVLLAVVLVVHQYPGEWRDRAISPLGFIVVISGLSVATYALSRCVFSRFTAPLVAVLIAGIVGGVFARPKVDNPAELAVLGTCVALSWVVGIGWLDARDDLP